MWRHARSCSARLLKEKKKSWNILGNACKFRGVATVCMGTRLTYQHQPLKLTYIALHFEISTPGNHGGDTSREWPGWHCKRSYIKTCWHGSARKVSWRPNEPLFFACVETINLDSRSGYNAGLCFVPSQLDETCKRSILFKGTSSQPPSHYQSVVGNQNIMHLNRQNTRQTLTDTFLWTNIKMGFFSDWHLIGVWSQGISGHNELYMKANAFSDY